MAEQRYRPSGKTSRRSRPFIHDLASCVAAPALLLGDTDLRNQGWKDSRDAVQFEDDGTVSVDLPEGSSLEVAVRADC